MNISSANSVQGSYFAGYDPMMLGRLPLTNNSLNGVQLPDLSSVTYAPPEMSDEEYKELIIAQAQKDFENNTFHKSEGFDKLFESYTAPYSPDRESIVSSGLNDIFSNMGISQNDGATAPQYDIWWLALLDHNQNGNIKINDTAQYSHVSFEVEQGQLNLSNARLNDEQGRAVVKYSNGQWSAIMTPEEAARGVEFREIYNDAWRALKDGEEVAATRPPVETKPAPLPENSTFEVRA